MAATIVRVTRTAVTILLVSLAAAVGCGAAPAASSPGLVGARLYRIPLLERPGASLTPAARSPGRPGSSAGAGSRVAAVTDRHLEAVDGAAIARTAGSLVGSRTGRDCVGFVSSVFRRHGIDLLAEGGAPDDNGVRILWRMAKRRGALHHRSRPDVGDLVFFDDTHDRNSDGRRNDPLTHVGVVEKVEGDTVTFVHRVARGVIRSRMNLEHPDLRKHGGTPANDYVRVGTARSQGPRLAGSLFAGFATLAGG